MVPYICNIPICKCIYIITCFLLGPAWNIIVQHFATIAWDHVALKQVHSLYETGLPWLVIFLLAHHGHYPKTPKTPKTTQKQTPGGWGCFWVFFLWRRFFTKHDPNSNSWPETGTGKFPLGLVHQKSTPQVPKIVFSLHFLEQTWDLWGAFLVDQSTWKINSWDPTCLIWDPYYPGTVKLSNFASEG